MDDCLLVIFPGKPGLLLLNPISRFVWDMLREGIAKVDVVAALSAQFNIDQSTITNDIDTLLAGWQASFSSPSEAGSPIANKAATNVEPAPLTANVTRAYHYTIHGRQFRFLISDLELEEEIRHRFASFEASASNGTAISVIELRRGEEGFVISTAERQRREEAVTHARIGLIQEVLALCFPKRTFIAALHAAAVTRGNRGLLLSAPTGGGKSTLTAALSASGYDVLTDDLAFLDRASLEISTISLAIMLRSGSWPLLRRLLPNLDSLPVSHRFGELVRFLPAAGNNLAPACRPRALVFLEFLPGAGCALTPVPAFEALVRLNGTRSWIDTEPPSVRRFLEWIKEIPRWNLKYSSLPDAIAAIRRLDCD